jgi:hypothetical protein
MQDDEPHSLPYTALHTLHDLIRHLPVGRMAPPGEHIGLVQHLLGEAVVRLLQGGCADFQGRLAGAGGGLQRIRDAPVHALRVDSAHGLVLLFVDVFAPDGDMDHGRIGINGRKA